MTELPKTFDSAEIESRWYAHWEQKGLFRPERPTAEPFTIVNPPPNVTGSLHIGHALDNTLQDIVIRYERLRGKDALWVVGTDHAGIATQMVVERQMEARQDKRTNYTREQFIDKVWEWKAESGGAITRQLRRLGCSMDWANERFTMDEGFSKAVVKVFVELHKRGLLYRDKRLVNWDPRFRSAISDLEVETQEVKGGFWHFRYPLADGVKLADGADHIVVATTRPETMLADMAVAVHPEDPRYKDVIGRDILQPITGRRFKIVGDEHADPELGSGAVKITPGHDFNDFEVGKRAGFRAAEMLNMFDADANVVQTADGLIPERFLGQHRFRRDGVDGARELVVAEMKALGLLVPHVSKNRESEEVLSDAEPRTIQTPFGDRSGVVIEPWLTDQWYVDAEKLAQAPMQAVRDGRIEIVPKSWEKTFFNWMENIQPWCVSRQLWWGHQIPAWYDEDGNPYVAESEEEAQALAGNKALTRDPDVLDTWFSSALWPFGTLGWPEQSETLARHYPNDLLISGFDILFFWDARMAMQGMEFMGDVPWRKLYLHGLVRAADGQKMSKSKGNVVDPLGLIDKFGADALRFFMAAMESQGRDVKMDEKRVEGYRNFATKLWNAARFLQSNGVTASASHEAPQPQAPVNRWIIAETVATVQAIDTAMNELRFDAAANAIYHFVWDQFCDWYIELTKGSMDAETKAVAGWAFDQILVMLHPFMPFITEELWNLTGTRETELIVARWPQALYAVDSEAQAEIDWLIRLISAMRTARTELNVPPGAKLAVVVHDASDETRRRIDRQGAALARLGRVESLSFGNAVTGGAAQIVVDEATFILPLEGVIDIEAEKSRLAKALAAAEKERDSLSGRLANPSFVEKAKPEAVAKAREDHAEKAAEAERLAAALDRLA
ncbi:valine--tRNA ligase [Sphingomonadales bacterium 56]|uniref:valine--tRNA ligase n=1 Tax=unclassified Sphingobium TaxID=2611147 RepID=UPI0019185CDE|nr:MULTISPECIES: valine--tRNA ligase [unclassified Sphingobium]MBY2928206.1 valine--tRNA ligase [Sphingomonadales bacterium 56]MBY2958306.1 valine--tRNA ligase [Sphingomonadales bacterium 58]CAD7336786.1 Valine--tRNA ligase [Sphingobium sp. S6]CAD7336845.1 Valine--tRNA ligase [Sphingobium sp. S8]